MLFLLLLAIASTEAFPADRDLRDKPADLLFAIVDEAFANSHGNQNVTEVRPFLETATSAVPADLARLDRIYYTSRQAWIRFTTEDTIQFLRDTDIEEQEEEVEEEDDDFLPFEYPLANWQTNISIVPPSTGTEPIQSWTVLEEVQDDPQQEDDFAKYCNNMTNFANMTSDAKDTVQTYLHRQKRDDIEDVKMNAVKEVTSTLPVGKAYIAKKFHYFRKEVPFAQMFAELTSLNFNLKTMNPTGADSSFKEIQGKTAKFLQTKLPKSFAQNSLTCAEIGGSVIGWSTVVTENIPVTLKIVTSDTVRVAKNTLSCEIYGVHKLELQCLEAIRSIAQTTGMEFTNKTMP